VEVLQPRSEEITHPTLVAIYRYWDGKRHGRALPARAEIDPTEITAVLPHLFMVDVERAPLRFRFRLIGTNIVQSVGRDFTGRTVSAENYSKGVLAEVLQIFTAVVETRRPVGWKGHIFYAAGREWLPTEEILLPLGKDESCIDIILGGFVAGPRLPTLGNCRRSRLILDPIIPDLGS
jgi:hypothetical protein